MKAKRQKKRKMFCCNKKKRLELVIEVRMLKRERVRERCRGRRAGKEEWTGMSGF